MVVGLLVILFFVCILVIGSILLQEDKSGGGMGVIGGSSQSFFGANSGSMLSKFSSVMLVIFLVAGMLVAIVSSHVGIQANFSSSDLNKAKMERYNVVNVSETNNINVINYVPLKLQVKEFENNLISSISNKDDSDFIKAIYQKKDIYYNYNFKQFKKSDIFDSLTQEDKKESKVKEKVLSILQGINYSLTAIETEIIDTSYNSDVTID